MSVIATDMSYPKSVHGIVLNTLMSHKFSICYYNIDDNRALPGSETQVTSTKWIV